MESNSDDVEVVPTGRCLLRVASVITLVEMRLLDRYLLREFLVPLGYCLCGFLTLWIFFDLFFSMNEFQSKKLHGNDIAEYYLVSMPAILAIILPITVLLALLYALTNHSRNHEITAIRAAGVSLWRLCLPYLAMGLLASLGLFALNELLVPDSSAAGDRIKMRREPKPAGSLAPNQISKFGFTNSRDGDRKWLIGVYNTDTAEMTDVTVIWKLADGSSRWMKAARAVRSNNEWVFYEVQEYNEPPESRALLMPIVQTNKMVFPEFTETPEEIKSEIKISGADRPQRGGSGTALKLPELSIREILSYLSLHPQPQRENELYTKLYGRLAAPWTCLVAVLIAIPFGAGGGRRNVFVGVATSIVICLLYYFLQPLCLTFGSAGYMPPWVAAWLPNFVFGAAGLWMTGRVR
jgi:lipopolysaccharide export system permease protein